MRCSGSGKRPDTRYDVKTGVFVRNLTNEEVCRLRGGAGEDDAEVGELDTASNDVEVGETAAASNDVGVGERATAASNGVH